MFAALRSNNHLTTAYRPGNSGLWLIGRSLCERFPPGIKLRLLQMVMEKPPSLSAKNPVLDAETFTDLENESDRATNI
jgi:hypothetical protein